MQNDTPKALSNELAWLSLHDLATLLRTREVTSLDVTHALLERIAVQDARLHSYALVTPEHALAQARAADADIAAGRYRGPLHGIPIGIKDLFWTAGIPTAGGMRVRRGWSPAEDATVVRRLHAAGAVMLGKLQLTEGAYSDHHPTVTAPVNPWSAAHWPGISSSGAGVATAAGLCYGAVASDTGGSIRWPAAANGLTGLKPSWGRVSRHGCIALAPSLDHVGVLARSAGDAAALFAAIAGWDPADPTSSCAPLSTPGSEPADGLRGLRVGVDVGWNTAGVDAPVSATVAAAADTLRALGAVIVEVRVPPVEQAVADWAPLCAVEAAVAHEDTYPAHREQYGPVLAGVLDAGRALSGMDYQKLLLRRAALRGTVSRLFADADLLLCPVQPYVPLTLATVRTLGAQPALIAGLQRYTCPFNLTGHPTLTLPGGVTDDGLPLAFQLVAAHMAEATLLRAGAAYQQATRWHVRHPEVAR